MGMKIEYSDAGTLEIDIPAAGLGLDALVGGTFAAGWFSVVLPATRASFSAGAVPLLFLLPFWLAGGLVVKQSLVDRAVSTSIRIGQYLWELEKTTAGMTINKTDGDSESLRGAVAEVVGYVNGLPQNELRLYTESKVVRLDVPLSAEGSNVL